VGAKSTFGHGQKESKVALLPLLRISRNNEYLHCLCLSNKPKTRSAVVKDEPFHRELEDMFCGQVPRIAARGGEGSAPAAGGGAAAG
jgi:hypothetical protein